MSQTFPITANHCKTEDDIEFSSKFPEVLYENHYNNAFNTKIQKKKKYKSDIITDLQIHQ